jgi:hypothetical protein
MSYVIAQAPSTQNFALGTDSKSVLTGVTSLCGPIEYSVVVPGYSFASVDAFNGIISVQSNLITDAGVRTATFKAKMRDYSIVAHVDIGFQITITNPCLTQPTNVICRCQEIILNTPQSLSITYMIGSPRQTLSLPSYTGNPSGCVLNLTYALNLVSKTTDTRFTKSPPFNQPTNTIPKFLTIEPQNGFIIDS